MLPCEEGYEEDGELSKARKSLEPPRAGSARQHTTTNKAITLLSVHGLVTPPHCSGRSRDVTIPTQRMVPIQSNVMNFCHAVVPSSAGTIECSGLMKNRIEAIVIAPKGRLGRPVTHNKFTEHNVQPP